MARSARGRIDRARRSRSTASRGSRARAAATRDPLERAGRRQPSDILVPGMPDVTPPARRSSASATRAPTTSRPATRSRASTPRSRPASTWSSSTCSPSTATAPGRLVLAHDYDAPTRGDALTLEEGLAHFARTRGPASSSNVDMKLRRLRGARRRRAARARPRRPRADLDDGGGEPARSCARSRPTSASAGRCRRSAATRSAAGPRGCPRSVLARYARRILPGRAATRDPRRADRRAHVPLGARDRRARRARSSDAGGELYVWTVDDAERIAEARGARASPASSRTTRGCSARASGASAAAQAAAGPRRQQHRVARRVADEDAVRRRPAPARRRPPPPRARAGRRRPPAAARSSRCSSVAWPGGAGALPRLSHVFAPSGGGSRRRS